ncbi:MAG: hypothetical protein R3F37_08465 [Candidatus Competibacteraceae bacterium]
MALHRCSYILRHHQDARNGCTTGSATDCTAGRTPLLGVMLVQAVIR